MRIRQSFTVMLILTITVILFAGSCDILSPYTKEKATEGFLAWIKSSGVPETPASPILGLDLGEVASGDVIGSYSPVVSVAKGMASGSYRGLKSISQKGRLFYLDEDPGAFYEHPGRILVLGTGNKVLYSESTLGWPVVNGTRPVILDSPSRKDYFNAIVYNPWQLVAPVTAAKDWLAAVLTPARQGAVVVNGLRSVDSLYSEATSIHGQVVEDMRDLYGEDFVESVSSSVMVADPADRISTAVNHLHTTQNVTNVTIYIIAHGHNDGVGIGGYEYDVDDLRTLMSDNTAIQFAVILETCHAGSWLDNFDGSKADYPAPSNLGIFIASTSAAKSAYPDWDTVSVGGVTYTDFDTSDSYVEWTSDFLKRLAWCSTGDDHENVLSLASDHGIPENWALYWYCYWKTKGSFFVPPNDSFNAPGSTYTFSERAGIARQEPMIYCSWLSDSW